MTRWVAEQPVDERTAEALALGQFRRYPMEVLCGACGGLGCERCQPEPPPASRWARFRAWMTREAGP